MIRTNLDLDALRGLLAGVSLESFSKAADYLGRSNSALSAQMHKLEAQTGVPLLRKAGRRLEPTPAGEVLIGYARRLIELNDEALSAVRGGDLDGGVRLGVQEDFETLLPSMLAAFARAHPKVRIEVRVTRNRDLLDRIQAGSLDLALTWGAEGATGGEILAVAPMCWIGQRSAPRPPAAQEALVMFEPPCLFRTAGVDALDAAGISWRPSFVSASLSGLWAAVEAGFGVTVRTPIGLPPSLSASPGGQVGWPALPRIALRLHQASATPATDYLGRVVREAVASAITAAGLPYSSDDPSSGSHASRLG
jgi:DNA-binding transcriptional LysR family regulator